MVGENEVKQESVNAQKEDIKKKERAREIVEKLKAIMQADKKDDMSELLKLRGKGDILDRMLEYYAMNKLISSMEGSKNDSDTFDSLMKYAILRDALKPQMDMTQLLLLMQNQNSNRGSDDLAKALLQMQQMQMQQNQQLLMLLFGDRFRQFEEQVKQQREDFITYLQHLEQRLITQPQSFTEELQRYKKFRELMLDFAESEGLTKEQVTNEKGQINWGALLNRIVKLGEKALTMKAQQQPPAMNFQEIPTTESVTTDVASPQENFSVTTEAPKGFTLPKVEEASPQVETPSVASPQEVVEGEETEQESVNIDNTSGDNEAGQGEAEESNTEQ